MSLRYGAVAHRSNIIRAQLSAISRLESSPYLLISPLLWLTLALPNQLNLSGQIMLLVAGCRATG